MTKELIVYPNRIRELRKARRMTQQRLGDAIQMSDVHIGYLEKGQRELGLSTMRALAEVFEVTTAEILSSKDNPWCSDPRARRLLENWKSADNRGKAAIEGVAEVLSS